MKFPILETLTLLQIYSQRSTKLRAGMIFFNGMSSWHVQPVGNRLREANHTHAAQASGYILVCRTHAVLAHGYMQTCSTGLCLAIMWIQAGFFASSYWQFGKVRFFFFNVDIPKCILWGPVSVYMHNPKVYCNTKKNITWDYSEFGVIQLQEYLADLLLKQLNIASRDRPCMRVS
jgi:hypothetical protein